MAQIIRNREQFQNARFNKKYGYNYRSNTELLEQIKANKLALKNNSNHPNAERLRAVITANEAEIAERKQDIANYGKQYDNMAHSHKAAMALGAVSVDDIETANAAGVYEQFKANLDPATKSLIESGAIDPAALYQQMTGKAAATTGGINPATLDEINKGFGL